jgi:alkylation response protein AidB-like acyl-CoA dehydrogenase
MTALLLTDDHLMAQKAARDFVSSRSPLKRAREGGNGLLAEMAGLGWLGLTLPEALGGAGVDHLTQMVVLAELGRNLVPDPLLATIFAASTLLLGGSPDQQKMHLPDMAAGKRLVAVAWQESGTRFHADRPRARLEDGGIHGQKVQVIGGMTADWFIVSAQVGDEVGLFLLPADNPRVIRGPQTLLDGRDVARVTFDGVRGERLAYGENVLGEAIDRATIALCAEMLGSAEAAFAMTLEYLKTRVQFGVPIGSFQALQHRAAKLYVDLELARSAVMRAHAVLDGGDGPPDEKAVARAASIAKAKLTEVFLAVALEGIQMHGGIGMTDEHDIGLYLKRARVAEMTFGDADFHRDRFATLSGF